MAKITMKGLKWAARHDPRHFSEYVLPNGNTMRVSYTPGFVTDGEGAFGDLKPRSIFTVTINGRRARQSYARSLLS